ncbi:MAG: hypothetical protein MUP21_11150, partial [Dehalococcoidia bacterium]|nr:hypothetical protein [Dehalococcoidia bacterium]
MEQKQTPGEDEMYCWSCGSVIKKEAELCTRCGVRIRGGATSQTGGKGSGWLLAGGVLGVVAGVFAFIPGISMVVDGSTDYWR